MVRTLAVLAVLAAYVAGCGGGGNVKRTAGCAPGASKHASVYRALPVAGQPVTAAAVDATVRRLCDRARAAGLSVDVKRTGADRIVIGSAQASLPRSLAARGQLEFYDWEANLLPPTQHQPAPSLKVAALIAAKQRPRAESTDVPVGGPSAAVLRRFGGDRRRIQQFYDRLNDTVVSAHAPRGVVILRDEPRLHPSGTAGYWVLEDDTELSNSEITNPRQQFDPQTDEPIVTFKFTPAGRRAFARVTRREAERGARVRVPAGADPAASFQRFAIALDHQIVSLATINQRAFPHGIPGSTGAQITGGASIGSARALAANLRAQPLPLELELVSRR
jgi:SecD/SecF fusion protein